jgi:hypothetical protein
MSKDATLRDLYRAAGHKPFLALGPNRKMARLLGFGPNGKIIGWFSGSDKIQEFEPDEYGWCWKGGL